MKFKPGDIAWVRHWHDEWEAPEGNCGWKLAVWDGIEQVVTILEHRFDEENGYVQTLVLKSDGEEFACVEDYLVDAAEAARMRKHNGLVE